MALKTASLLLKCVSAMLLPFVWIRPAAACPKDCRCTTTDVWCFGGRYPRLPDLPVSVRSLTMIEAEVTKFALSDLSAGLIKAEFRRLNTTVVDNAHSPSSNLTRLSIDGCCTDRFPNISGLADITDLQFTVRCRPDTDVIVSPDLIPNWMKDGSKSKKSQVRIRDSCLAAVQPEALRRLFMRFSKVDVAKNRLRELRMAASDKKMDILEKLIAADNPHLSVVDLGSTVSVRQVDISGTRVTLDKISLKAESLRTLEFQWGTQPLSLGDVCRKFTALMILNLRGHSSLNVSEARQCKNTEDLNIMDSGLTEIADMSRTKVYRFRASNNSFQKLDLSLFSTEIAHIDVSDNLINRILFRDCTVLQDLKHLELSGNSLDLLPGRLISCLSHTSLELSIARNPMRDVFQSLNVTGGPRSISKLNMTSVGKVQEVGELPRGLIDSFGVSVLVAEDNGLRSLATTLETICRQRQQRKIIELWLGRNKFTEIQAKAFLKFKNLNILNLAHNRISAIADTAFVGLVSLATLNLRGNKLTVAGQWLTTLPFSTTAHLSGNNFYCGCSTLKSWNSSNAAVLSYNSLMKVNGLVCSSPRIVRYFPILTAIREMGSVLCAEKTTEKPVTTVLSRTELVIILSVVAISLLILSVVLISFIIARKRKVSYSLVRKESIPLS